MNETAMLMMSPSSTHHPRVAASKLAVVTIDGPAGSGKSTVAHRIAEQLKFEHVDTGAMYRALTLKVLKSGVAVEDEARVAKIVSTAKLELNNGQVTLDGQDVTLEIRSAKVTRHVSRISSYPAVRSVLLARQRDFVGRYDGIVMEGRDIGTVVFPNARWKFFLDASPEVRAERRHAELAAAGRPHDIRNVLNDIRERDRTDAERAVAPLKCPDDAVVIDSSALDADQVVQRIIEWVRKN